MEVEKIINLEPNAFNGLTKTTFTIVGALKPVYIFSKPENEPKEGDVIDGTYAPDKAGNLKFTKTKKEFTPSDNTPANSWQPKEYKADPLKQSSIEWQASIKAAVDTVKDFHVLSGIKPTKLTEYKRLIAETAITYANTVEKKPDMAVKVEPVVDLPPVESYDIPDVIDLDDIPF